jgi:predicted ATPase
MSLFSNADGKVADDMLFTIADQIKHGVGNLAAGEDPELRLDMAKLYGLASSKAAAFSDHAASCSYLKCAFSLLPTDHWTRHYKLSLSFSLRLAESCYSCGDVQNAQAILRKMTPLRHSIEDQVPALSIAISEARCILQEITGHCHTIEDKLPAYSLLARSEWTPVVLRSLFE